MRTKRQVFAVLRVDEFLGPDAPIESRVAVNQVVESQEFAEREVERLTRLNGHKGCRYFWQATRWVERPEAEAEGPAE